MGVLLQRGMRVPPRQGLHLRQLRRQSWFGYAAGELFLRRFPDERGPASRRAPPSNSFDPASALDECAALGLAGGFRRHREALALAGVQALAGIRRALAGALALAGIGGHALALRSVGR